MAPKPDIVFLPGAWHPASCLDGFMPLLEAKGYATHAHTLKSVGTPGVTVQDDAAHIRDGILEPLFQQGREVVLVVHSYAGIASTSAIAKLHRSDREARGLPGGLVGIIWVASYLFSTDGFTPMGREERIKSLDVYGGVDEENGVMHPKKELDFFYGDVEEGLAKKVHASLRPHSLSAFLTDIDEYGYREASYDGCRAYVKALQDKAIPTDLQNTMIGMSQVTWETRELDTSHSPFLSQPQQLADTLDELIQGFKI